MNSKNDLITGLQNALRLMNDITVLQNKRNNIQMQYARPAELKSTWAGKKFSVRFLLIAIVITVFASDIISNVLGPIFWVIFGQNIAIAKLFLLISGIGVGITIAVVIKRYFNKQTENKNNEIIERNNKLEERNQFLYKEETSIIQQIEFAQQQYANEVLPWYPSNYCYIDAVEFFINSIQNLRADSLKEAINLYEDALHKGRMERAQNDMVKQQKLGNLLAVGGLFMQAGIQNSINNNTAAMNTNSANLKNSIDSNTSAINNLNPWKR